MATIEEYSPQIKQVLEWIDQFRYGSAQNNAIVRDHRTVLLYTDHHKYAISATEKYLGCTSSNRKQRAGENWNRGSDLADGAFSEETWRKILHDIVGYELVKAHKTEHGKRKDFTIQKNPL